MKSIRRKVMRGIANWSLRLAIGFLPIGIAQAQTFNVIHTFTGGADGGTPSAGLTMDRSGNLYGTASTGGSAYDGTAYRLKRSGSDWTFELLYQFTGSPDGADPASRLIFGPDGALYGTTAEGGVNYSCLIQGEEIGCGTIFKLRPPATFCASVSCPWTETNLYRFQGGSDGGFPVGDLTFDSRGNIYGATSTGGVGAGMCNTIRGVDGCGVVYELSPSEGGWTPTTLYMFQGPADHYADGVSPAGGVILDNAGSLYGTTLQGGTDGYNGFGVVYEVSSSGGQWSEKVLYSFTGGNDGSAPVGGLIFDNSGNLFGTASRGGMDGGGTVFKLANSGTDWSLTTINSLVGAGLGSYASLTMDQAGNLYGTTFSDGAYGYGSVFELTPSGNNWTYHDLYDFTDDLDGAFPSSSVAIDASGNLYGTASAGGPFQGACNHDSCGVVWEITP